MTEHDIFTSPASLGFGAMRLPSDAETCRKMFDAYLDAGFAYFDTAYVYGGSEEMLKKALVKHHPRESFYLADKLPPWSVNSRKDCDRLLGESLKRCGTDYFDCYLMHSLNDDNERSLVKAGAYEWAAEQKKKGALRHVGFSFHGSAALLEHLLSTHPEMEFAQLQLNYMDVLRGQAGELQQIAIKHNVPIIVMEPVKGGTLARLPAPAEAVLKKHAPGRSIASWAIRYAASLEGVSCLLSGMSAPEQVADNLATFNPLVPLAKEELEAIEEVLLELSKTAAIPCTGCKYCVADCPMQIDIPVCFSLYNGLKRGDAQWNRQNLYSAIPKGKSAADCTACGTCKSHCPQNIDIPNELKTVANTFR
jgi:predicted aldo/keto reductase-like oxidoreductase